MAAVCPVPNVSEVVMARVKLLLSALLLGICGLVLAQEVPLINGRGVIDKVEKGSITIRPRGAGGQFEKAITLKVTGTSSFTQVGTRKTKAKVIVTQKTLKSGDLAAKQAIAFIYTTEGGTPTLLSGVVQPGE
jgi:hypothetical protein